MLRINLRRSYNAGPRQKILNHLIDMFCDDYDMSRDTILRYIITDDEHLNIFVKYLNDNRFSTRIFRLNGVKDDTLSWGLEFDDDCEGMTLLKLKFSDT